MAERLTAEAYIRTRVTDGRTIKIGEVCEVCGCTRQNVYQIVERSTDLIISNGMILYTKNNVFLKKMMDFGMKIDGDFLTGAIKYATSPNFDPDSIFSEEGFPVDEDGNGLKTVLQALVVALTCDLPFTMTLTLGNDL